MTQFFYIDAQGTQVGPMTKSELAAAGIARTTMVWCQGLADWTPAARVPELADVFATVPPPYGQRPQYQPPTPRPQNPGSPVHMKPDNFLWLGILTTIICFLPLGIVSIVYATKVDTCWNMGDEEGAINNSNSARNWGIAAAVTGVVVGLIIFVIAVSTPRHSYYWY